MNKTQGILFSLLFLLSSLFYSCDKEVTSTPPDSEPERNIITFTTNPPGYSIYLNNKISGKTTPDSLSFLDSGNYNIELKHNIYLDTSMTINLMGDERKNIQLDLTSLPRFYSQLRCTSDPAQAEIIIDDSSTGIVTPNTLSGLYPGNHRIRYSKLGYRSKELGITLLSNALSNIHINLEDTTIWLIYNSANSQLPSNSLHCLGVNIMYESEMWVGTDDQGAVSLSGSHWENFNISNSVIPMNMINAISIGENEKVLIATLEGLAVYQNNNWFIFNAGNSTLQTNEINDVICLDPQYSYVNGNLVRPEVFYLATNAGVFTYNGDSLAADQGLNNHLPSLSTTCFGMKYSYNSRVLAVGTKDAGLLVSDNSINSYNIYNSANSGFISDQITAIEVVSGSYDIYAGVKISSGLGPAIGMLYYHPNNGQWEEVNFDYAVINSVKADFTKTWVGTNNGLYLLENHTQIKEHYTAQNSPLPSNNIYDVEIDRAGKLWLATGKGLVRFKTN